MTTLLYRSRLRSKSLAERIAFYERKTFRLYRMKGGRHRLRRLVRLTLYRSALDRAIISRNESPAVRPEVYERLRKWWIANPQ